VRNANEEEKRARYQAGEISLDIYDMRRRLADAGLEYVDSLDDLKD
jgi:4-hydroxy-4-methyl-2-oxoglutarate aldolase